MYIYYKGQKDNRRIEVTADEDSESPREWGRVSHMVCAHDRYSLGDEQAKYIRFYDNWWAWFIEEVLGIDREEILYDVSTELGDAFDDLSDAEIDTLIETKEQETLTAQLKDIVFLPLHLYDHGGLSMSWTDATYPFCDRWDSGQVGWIYVWKDEWVKANGEENWKERALECLKIEVAEYNEWLEGNVFRITALEDDEIVDSISGVYANNREELEEAVVDYFGSDWRMELEDQ
jgi:hypothetical protein